MLKWTHNKWCRITVVAFSWLGTCAACNHRTPLTAGALPALSQSSDSSTLKVVRSEPNVKYKTLNAWWNLFDNPPELKGDEKGVTKSNFLLTVRYQFTVVKRGQSGTDYSVTIQPTRTLVQLALPITIWTPWGAPAKLMKHEEGHRRIAERVYSEAEAIARFYAGSILEKTFDGRGASESEAVESAYGTAAQQLNDAYRKSVFEYSRCVNQEYDRVTQHGLANLEEDAAIEQSFKKYAGFLGTFEEARLATDRERKTKPPTGPVTPLIHRSKDIEDPVAEQEKSGSSEAPDNSGADGEPSRNTDSETNVDSGRADAK